MNKSNLIFICCFFTAIQTFAQEKFEPAVVITISKDTLRGFVENKDWIESPENIRYRKTMTGEIKIFLLDSLESFLFESGKRFVVRNVDFHYYTENISELQEQKTHETTKLTLLMNVLVQGKASLYSIKDENNIQHFFIEKKGDKTDELILQKEVVSNQSGKQYIHTVNKYRNSLSYFMNDCKEIVGKLENLPFNENDLQNLFTRYNECVSPSENQFVGKKDKLKVIFGLLAGVSNTSVTIKSDNQFLNESGELSFPSSTNFMGGVFLNIAFPGKFYKYSLCNEFLVKSYSTKEGTIIHGNYGVPPDTLMYTLDFTYFKIVTMINVDLSSKDIRPFIKVGIGNSFALKNRVKTESALYFSTDYSPILDRTYEQSVIVGAGVKNNRFSGCLYWEAGNGFSSATSVKTSTSTFFILLGFSF